MSAAVICLIPSASSSGVGRGLVPLAGGGGNASASRIYSSSLSNPDRLAVLLEVTNLFLIAISPPQNFAGSSSLPFYSS